MSDKIHASDRFCRNLLTSFPYADGAANYLCEKSGENSEEWPNWCELPMSLAFSILTMHAEEKDDAMRIIGKLGLEKIGEMTVALIWMRYKVVYHFDADLPKVLAEQFFNGNIPDEALHAMPYPCVFVEHLYLARTFKYWSYVTACKG